MLNDRDFLLLAGQPKSWDDETRRRCRPGRGSNTVNSEDLIKVHVEQHQRGRREAQLVRTIYGWSVRYASTIDNCALLFPGENAPATLAECILWGRAWADEDPANREFFGRKRSLLDVAARGEVETMSGGEKAVCWPVIQAAMTP